MLIIFLDKTCEGILQENNRVFQVPNHVFITFFLGCSKNVFRRSIWIHRPLQKRFACYRCPLMVWQDPSMHCCCILWKANDSTFVFCVPVLCDFYGLVTCNLVERMDLLQLDNEFSCRQMFKHSCVKDRKILHLMDIHRHVPHIIAVVKYTHKKQGSMSVAVSRCSFQSPGVARMKVSRCSTISQ